MSTTFVSEKLEKKPEIKEINMPDEKKEDSKNQGRQNLLIMTAISLVIMFIAVGMIYYNIKVNPDLVHNNDQNVQISANSGYVNHDSLQKLEHDTSNITVTPAEHSDVFVIIGVGLMVVMAGAFIFVKIMEHKEDN